MLVWTRQQQHSRDGECEADPTLHTCSLIALADTRARVKPYLPCWERARRTYHFGEHKNEFACVRVCVCGRSLFRWSSNMDAELAAVTAGPAGVNVQTLLPKKLSGVGV